jgi:hypothetical protein
MSQHEFILLTRLINKCSRAQAVQKVITLINARWAHRFTK